jgi:hypothetical protein
MKNFHKETSAVFKGETTESWETSFSLSQSAIIFVFKEVENLIFGELMFSSTSEAFAKEN